jgi:hypothetical protein
MQKSSLEELKGQIAAGDYAVDSGKVAGAILSTFALIRRVGRRLMSEEEEGAAGEPGRGPQTRRRTRPAPSHPLQPRRQRLQ